MSINAIRFVFVIKIDHCSPLLLVGGHSNGLSLSIRPSMTLCEHNPLKPYYRNCSYLVGFTCHFSLTNFVEYGTLSMTDIQTFEYKSRRIPLLI